MPRAVRAQAAKAAAPTFQSVAREARAWLAANDPVRDTSFEALIASASLLVVPEARRVDWEKLLTGLRRDGADPRRVARVEALVRACRLFFDELRREERARAPLSWRADLTELDGLGPQTSRALAAFGVKTPYDLVWTLPSAFDDLRAPLDAGEAVRRAKAGAGPELRVAVAANVQSASIVPMRGRRAVRLVAESGGAKIHAWWFFFAKGVLVAVKARTAWILVGRLRVDAKKPPRMVHPDLIVDDAAHRTLRARYPRLGVPGATMRRALSDALARIDEIPDPVPQNVAQREAMPEARALVLAAHGRDVAADTSTEATIANVRAARERLAWVEAFARVRARLLAEERFKGAGGIALRADRAVQARLRAELGFDLTAGQKKAIDEIAKDLARPLPMRRLLLGDVGTGKTAVALSAAAQCVSAGAQAAILAPTSLLAEQYLDAVAPLARATGASIALVTGADRASARRHAAERLARGDIQVAIGTHALLSEDVRFHKLALVVVDEQHRLGVAQRLSLVAKGKGDDAARALRPHLLTLSATPIPRTLALALRGELATSSLEERPRGRPPVVTEKMPRSRIDAVVAEIRATCARGERVFFVCPRIAVDEDDDEIDPSLSAVERAGELRGALRDVQVALVHGGLRPDEKSAAMRAFRSGEAQVLVGTTVVEVGVDVPEATLMIIDGASLFGIAQLHQMRGRVGRGERPGRCILLHDEPLDDLAARRLNALCTLSRGVDVARADLELRGSGDLGGTRQSGAEEDELLYLDPLSPPAWLAHVEADARAIHRRDPRLEAKEHAGLRATLERLAVAIAVREEAG